MNVALNDVMPYVALIVVCMLFTIPGIWGFFFTHALLGTILGILQKAFGFTGAANKEKEQAVLSGLDEGEEKEILSFGSVAMLATLVAILAVSTAFFINRWDSYDPYELSASAPMVKPETIEASQSKVAADEMMQQSEAAASDSTAVASAPAASPAPAATASAAGVGESVFKANCLACHQANGQGIPGAFPPLAGSEWVTKDRSVPVRIILRGLQGPITVAGVEYNSVMAGLGGNLDDTQISAVVNYISTAWGNTPADAEEMTPERVGRIRNELGAGGLLTVSDLQ